MDKEEARLYRIIAATKNAEKELAKAKAELAAKGESDPSIDRAIQQCSQTKAYFEVALEKEKKKDRFAKRMTRACTKQYGVLN